MKACLLLSAKLADNYSAKRGKLLLSLLLLLFVPALDKLVPSLFLSFCLSLLLLHTRSAIANE